MAPRGRRGPARSPRTSCGRRACGRPRRRPQRPAPLPPPARTKEEPAEPWAGDRSRESVLRRGREALAPRRLGGGRGGRRLPCATRESYFVKQPNNNRWRWSLLSIESIVIVNVWHPFIARNPPDPHFACHTPWEAPSARALTGPCPRPGHAPAPLGHCSSIPAATPALGRAAAPRARIRAPAGRVHRPRRRRPPWIP